MSSSAPASAPSPLPHPVLKTPKVHKKSGKARVGVVSGSDSDAEDDGMHDDLEVQYASRERKKKASLPNAPAAPSLSSRPAVEGNDELDSGDENDENAPPPQHESLAGPSEKRDRGSKNKLKYVPEGESKEQRGARTIFVGNLPAEIVKNKVRAVDAMFPFRFTTI